MQIKCVKLLRFCSGHRVVGHENKCKQLHGHNYKAEIYATAYKLDEIGRIVDFSVIKDKVGGWIDKHWDHKTILFVRDPNIIEMMGLHQGAIFSMPKNPTAENMARYLLETVCPNVLVGHGVTVDRVKLWETDTCFAEASFLG